MNQTHRIILLVVTLLSGTAKGQGLIDAMGAAAASGNAAAAGAGSGADLKRMQNIKSGAEAAMSGGPYGRGANWVPGMPVPESGGAAPSSQQGRGPAAAPGREGLILWDQYRDDGSGGGGDEGGPAEAVPEQYIVVKGDTLWSICQRFFNNPWYWPKLWSYNDLITNPHWIYPGDLLQMYPPGQRPQKPAEPKKEQPSPQRIRVNGPPAPSGLYLRQNGFVEPGELDAAGKIVGSKEEKLMLASLDEVYIETSKSFPFKVGERYTIYKPLKTLRRPYGAKETLGNVVEIVGEVQVRQVTSGGIARAVIREALAPIERGFRVGPLRRTYKLVDPTPNTVNREGVLIETLLPSTVLGSEQLLFVDLGKESGMKVGNRLLVVRRGDGSAKVLSLEPVDDKRFPREVVAELIIVDVRDKISAALITRSTKETRVGDRVEARQGY